MRFLLLALMFTGTAFAQTSERNLVDLMYVPNAGTLFGETKFTFEGNQYNVEDDTEVDTHNRFISQTVGFGLTDNMSFSLGYRHQFQGEVETGVTGSGRDAVDYLGPEGLTLGGILRVMEQGTASYNFDVLAKFTPDLIQSESENNDDTEFTAGRGGAIYMVGARMGQKNVTSHWAIQLDLSMLGDAETEYDSGDDATVDTHYVLDLSYSMQEQMLSWLDFRGRVGLSRTSSIDRESATGTETEDDAFWTGSAKGTLLVSAVPNRLVLFAGAGGFYSPGYDRDTDTGDTEVNDFKGWMIDLGALYQF